MELPKTEAELQALLDARESEITETLNAKHNSDMANMRKKHESELAREREKANMSAEEIANQKLKEQQEAQEKELSELRAYKKQAIISEKVEKAKLPSVAKNDSRLINANEGDLDKVIKEISKEYEGLMPKGAKTSTIVTTANGQRPKGSGDEKSVAFEQMGEFIKGIIS